MWGMGISGDCGCRDWAGNGIKQLLRLLGLGSECERELGAFERRGFAIRAYRGCGFGKCLETETICDCSGEESVGDSSVELERSAVYVLRK